MWLCLVLTNYIFYVLVAGNTYRFNPLLPAEREFLETNVAVLEVRIIRQKYLR